MIESLHLRQFTAFEEVKLAFCPGVNVFVGANATGKTHLLKVMYAVLRADHNRAAKESSDNLYAKLLGVFNPADRAMEHLQRPPRGDPWISATIKLDRGEVEFSGASYMAIGTTLDPKRPLRPSLFLPTREMVTLAPWLPALYRKREVEVDETEVDLCEALLLPPLKNPPAFLLELVKPLEKVLGGEVILEDQRFRVTRPGDAPDLEATLLAEGHRKLAGLIHLVRNGSLDAKTVVFWDEPEASLNPALMPVVVEVIRALAASGTQLFVTTHDYLLSQQLSLLAEENAEGTPAIRFFGLHRDAPESPVEVEAGDTLAHIERNPILDGFLDHRRRETEAFARGA